MKSMAMMRWARFVCLGALTACSGAGSTIGSGDEPSKGGSSNANGTGGSTVLPGTGGVTMGGKSPGTGGITRDPGMGGTPPVECANDMDCAVDLNCHVCPDGNEICSKAVCLPGGKCARQEPICSNIVECQTNRDCPVLDLACKDCGDGTEACPTAECVMGVCQNSFSGCVNQPGTCDTLACGAPCDAEKKLFCNEQAQCQMERPSCVQECRTVMDCRGPLDAKCTLCDDGSCAKPDCIDGLCQQSCENAGGSCKVVEDCAVVGDICIKCPVTNQCAVQACVQNSCQMVCPVP